MKTTDQAGQTTGSRDANQIVMLAAAEMGSRIKFAEEKQAYTVQARSERYLVCTKPFNARRTVLYTIIDCDEGVRGTENLIFGAGFETQEECKEAIDRLEGRDNDLGFATEVSHRNRVALRVIAVRRPIAKRAAAPTPGEPQ